MKFEVKNGSFFYQGQEPVLKNVNFTMEKPEIMTILGANGAGKTTLLKCMVGLLKWTDGNSYVDGEEISKINYRDLWKKIGYVPQAKERSCGYLVEDMIVLGRNAYLGTFGQPGKNPIAKTAAAFLQPFAGGSGLLLNIHVINPQGKSSLPAKGAHKRFVPVRLFPAKAVVHMHTYQASLVFPQIHL